MFAFKYPRRFDKPIMSEAVSNDANIESCATSSGWNKKAVLEELRRFERFAQFEAESDMLAIDAFDANHCATSYAL